MRDSIYLCLLDVHTGNVYYGSVSCCKEGVMCISNEGPGGGQAPTAERRGEPATRNFAVPETPGRRRRFISVDCLRAQAMPALDRMEMSRRTASRSNAFLRPPDLAQGVEGGAGGHVAGYAGQVVVGVAQGHHTGVDRQLLALEPRGIARAVHELVVEQDAVGRGLGHGQSGARGHARMGWVRSRSRSFLDSISFLAVTISSGRASLPTS